MRLSETAQSGWLWRAVAYGGCAVLGLWIIGWLLGAMFLPLRRHGQAVMCQSNVFRLSRAQLLYADDCDDHFPIGDRWMDRTMPYVIEDRRFHCPTVSLPGETKYGYAMNSQLSGSIRGTLVDPDNIPLIFDSSNLAASASDPFTSLPNPPRHLTKAHRGIPSKPGNYVGYATGSARILIDRQLSTARKDR